MVAQSPDAKLSTALNGRTRVSAGGFQLIGVADARLRLGAAWSRVEERVHEQVRKIIERRIAPNDVYFPCGPEDYVVVFADLDKTKAQFVCAKILEEVQRTLFGVVETQNIQVRTAVTEINGTMRLEKTTLADLLAAVTVEYSSDEELSAGPTVTTPVLPKAHSPEKASILYRPVWDVKNEVLSTYFSRRSATHLDAAPNADGGPITGLEFAWLDADELRLGIELLTELYENKFRFRLSFPVNFETLAQTVPRRTYLDACRSIPQHVRKLVAFELVDLPSGVPYGRLAALTGMLAPFCGQIFATCRWHQVDFSQYARAGIRLINAVIPRGADEKTVFSDLDRFARSTENAGLQSSVEGIGTASLALAAKAAGIGFISGDRIGRIVEVPEHMLRFTWMELYFGQQRST
jgi:hypothetical protein